ncbi:MAG: c-type cytochrome [Burkholderiaceae bacterium]
MRESSLARPLMSLGLALGFLLCQSALALPNADSVARGKYLVEAGGCQSCHTAEGGQPFAGGLYVDTPFGQVASPNITPDRKSGIGAWSDEQFYQAMHDGKGQHGEYLYPVMPFPWYTRVTRDDIMAIRAYLNTVAPVEKADAPNKLRFPFSIRAALGAWRAVFFKPGEFKPNAAASAEINRGDYLVNGLAHCGECHDARPVAGQSKFDKSFQGGVIDNWYAPNITGDARDGMAETVKNLSNLSTADLRAMAAYLKSTPPVAESHEKLALFEGRNAQGVNAYLSYCASCHGADGKGIAGIIPALQNNSAVTAKGPENVIQVVLGGLDARGGYAPMIAAGAGMSDEEIADVTNYVRQTGANSAPASAEPGLVAKLRGQTQTLMNGAPAEGCKKIDNPAIAQAVARAGTADLLAKLTDANSTSVARELVQKLHQSDPQLTQADLINAITATYCPILLKDPSLNANWRALKLGQFSEEVYLEAHPAQQKNARLATVAHGG